MSNRRVPDHWTVALLGDHCMKPQYGFTASAQSNPVGPKLLRITDLQEDTVDWESVPYADCDSQTRDDYRLAPGDLVIARIGATTGKAHLLEKCPEAVFASYLIRLRTKPSLAPDFLGFFLPI
jgi:type I restriction enzyme S subunit